MTTKTPTLKIVRVKKSASKGRGRKAGVCYECKHAIATAAHPLVSGAFICEGCADGFR